MPTRLGGHAVVEQMLTFGVDAVFCVPGESYLPVIDGLYEARDRVRTVTARHEGGAAFMAAAYGRLTGRPGVCLVTRGPGATNASIGVHAAAQDCSPLVLFIGQVDRSDLGRAAFQEVDYRSMFASVAKAVFQIEDAERIPELVSRAFHTAVSGEPGPVVVALPADILYTAIEAPVVPAAALPSGVPAPGEIAEFLQQINEAERPLILVGGAIWSQAAADDLRVVAETLQVPVVTAARRQDFIDNASSAYVGSLGLGTVPTLAARVRDADCLVLLGSRPDGLSMSGAPQPLAAPIPRQRLLHIYPDPDVFNTVYRADWACASDPRQFIAAVREQVQVCDERRWVRQLREEFTAVPQLPQAAEYMAVFNEAIPADALIALGAGSYTAWAQKHRTYACYPSQLASHSGAMGYGLPAAIAAKVAVPERTVVAFAGDGCMLMNGQELATAVQYHLDVLVIVVNNHAFGTIRNHQDTRFPGRRHATGLVNPDFAAFARSFGAFGDTATTPHDLRRILARALETAGPAVIEIQASQVPDGG